MAYTAKFEKFQSNDARTSLNGAIDASQTSIPVVFAGDFPTDGNFRVVIDSEIMLVTAVSGNTFTVTRGAEGSTATVHDDNSDVNGVMTAGSMEQVIMDHSHFYKAKPQLGKMVSKAGALLTMSDFTWVNKGTASAVNAQQGGIRMEIPRTAANNPDLRMLVRSAPSTPYTVTACLSHSSPGRPSPVFTNTSEFSWLGIGFRESATGKIVGAYHVSKLLQTVRWSDPTTTSLTAFSERWAVNPRYYWIRIEDDGTNLKTHWSNNGIEFQEYYTELRGAFFTTAPDQICIIGNGRWPATVGSNANHIGMVLHWSEA